MIVTTAAHAAIGGDLERPESAVADGLARVASRELANVTTRVVDVYAGDAARAIDEIESADRETIVAYRNGRRWLPRFETVPLPERASGSPALRDGSVWLVTGGSGGLGLAVTSALVSRLHARVAVISRHATTNRAIADLKRSGADLLALDADVTDSASIAAAVAATTARFGRIDGVVHAAGLSGGGLIALKTATAAAAVLAPKVAGTRALLDALSPHSPAVVVLFSSIAAITGNIGQADYAAGNAFLDAIAQAAPAGPTRVISINWDAWQDVGMAAEAATTASPRHREQRADRLRLGIPPDRGVEAFFRILSQPFAQVTISPAGLAARLAEANAEAAGVQSATAPAAQSTGAPRHARPELDTPHRAPSTAGEHTLAAIWEELLGTSGIGLDDNFFDLGGDSLLATQLIARLRTAFGQEWSLRDLMAYATIAALSAAIDAKLAAPALADAALLAEIDSLSDEQAEARLRALSGRSEG
jgi:NADP-dependent 3-hydroxy acid dehydrogenase YdfG/acyl carrier protein